MTRPSRLWRNLGLTTGELLGMSVGAVEWDQDVTEIGHRIERLSIQRGAAGVNAGFRPSTLSCDTTANLRFDAGTKIAATLTPAAASAIAAATYTTPAKIRDRWRGRLATCNARDTRYGRRGTRLSSGSWVTMLRALSTGWTPSPSGTGLFSLGLTHLLAGFWADIPAPAWIGDADQFDQTQTALSAEDYLRLLQDRLYGISDQRDGSLHVLSLEGWRGLVAAAANTAWPLARAHVRAPIEWTRDADQPRNYYLKRRHISGDVWTVSVVSDYPAADVVLDWTSTWSLTDQWQRVRGVAAENRGRQWSLGGLLVPIDRLVASRYESHRRAAGMVLGLNIGDAVALADDWSGASGVHIVAGLGETITPDGWTITLSLSPSQFLAGDTSPAIPPRTWDQSGNRTWQDASTRTWNEGLTA